MKQNVAYRSAPLIVSILLAILLLPPLLGAAEHGAGDGTKGRETPQALVATFNEAVARKDWKKCYLCCDAKWCAELLGSMFHGIAMSHDEKLKEIVKKHLGEKLPAADEIAIPVVRSDTRMFKELLAFEKSQKQFRDLPAFVDEISNAAGDAPFPALRDVRDIRITGDMAVGQGRLGYPPPADMLQPIHFCKLDGRWYLTIPDPPPPLSVPECAAQLKAEVGSFSVNLVCSHAAGDNQKYGQLMMSVYPYRHRIHLSEAQAKKLIEHLATEGFSGTGG